jgi:hypothetical protein
MSNYNGWNFLSDCVKSIVQVIECVLAIFVTLFLLILFTPFGWVAMLILFMVFK